MLGIWQEERFLLYHLKMHVQNGSALGMLTGLEFKEYLNGDGLEGV